MSFITDYFTHLLVQYGYWVLFFALMLELIALPLPGEFIMTYAGLIVYQGQLNWILCIVAAGLGSCIGMTISYWIGFRLGTPFFEKYGRRFHFGPEKLHHVSRWYSRYGNKLLLVAYFIPGVRHMTGLFSGITRLPFRKYAAFAFTGAVLWVSIFISLGRLLGPKWESYHHAINRYLIIAGVIMFCIYLCIYVYRKKKDELKAAFDGFLEKGVTRFHSMGKVKFIVVAAFAFFVLFTSLLIGLIQDFLAHELTAFDEVTVFIVQQIFDQSWTGIMNNIALLGSYSYFIPIIVITGIWIALKGIDRTLELTILVVVTLAGKGLNELLRIWFHREGPSGGFTVLTFPSQQTMLALTIYGFAAYLIFRHYGNYAVRFIALIGVITVCFSVGICLVFLQLQYPSDVAAGYVFGGVWLSMSVILLEVLRMIRGLKRECQ
ncbi:bifunctional DedA family/phosphatase PAP2 family protein [Cohnella terricola]|uniref:Alkaline phosphatase n=1 Tax=Cohnella terricola TaxID=1289167 RepID=A0A559JQE2_9BACL|nr:bifunctional DedA family/phosphatase PAP2 family protein [Cohnella terricola]TVY02095.1 alkaline phosphatase [Cohnella terricola]